MLGVSVPSSLPAALGKLLRLAWPIIIARASQSIIGFSDALLTAPLGAEALAAVTTASLNAFLAIIFPQGVVFILQSFTSQLRGRGELGAVRRYAWYGLGFALLAELGTLALIPLIPLALGGFEYTPTVRAHIETYLQIRLLSVGPAVATEALGNWYGGLGHTRPAMVAGLTAMIGNVVGCLLLIEPRLGLPGYGVAGAAWAGTLGTVLGLIVIAVPFARGWGCPPRPERLGLRWRELGRVLRFGLPNGVNWFLEFGAFIVFINVMVAHLGTTPLAAFNVVLQLNSVAFMPAFGLGSAGAILVGEAIGQRDFAAARRFVRLAVAIAAAWMGSVGLVYLMLPGPLMRAFAGTDPGMLELIVVGTLMLHFSALWQLFDAVAITLSEALRAAGDTTWCMVTRIVLAWFLFLPLAWFFVLEQGGGVAVVMSLMVGYILILATTFTWRFLSGRWQGIDLIGEPEPMP